MQEVGVKLILEGAGGFMSELGNANAAVDKFASQANSSAQSAGGGFSALEQIAIGSLRKIGEAAVQAGAQAAQAIVGFVGQSISAAGNFEDGMNQFAAATGGSLEAAGLDIKDFENLFLEMGQKLPVSTADVQAAALALAKGGLDPAVLAAGGLESSLNFASAAGMGLAEAAELGVKMLGTFTSVTDDSATKTAFLASSQDLLVKAANASTLNVDALGDAMLAAGGQARAVGLDYQDFVTTMGLISPAFGSAAEAGTSFKNFLIRLQPTTAPAKEAMQGLGLMTFDTAKALQFLAEKGITPISPAVDDVKDAMLNFMEANQFTQAEQEKFWAGFDKSKFYDAQGNFIGMEAASQLLQDSLAGLTNEQRVMALQTIFGNDAMGAAAALADGGAAAYQAFAEQMGMANGVQAQSAAVQQGLDFQMQNFMGSVEALQITLGTMLIPTLTTLFETVITPGINTVLSFVQALGGNETALATLSPMLQGAVTILQTLTSTLMDAGPFSAEFAEALGLVHPALQPLMNGITQAANWLQNNWQTAVAVAGGVLAAALVPALAAGAAAFGAAMVAAAPIIAVLAGVGIAAVALKSVWDQNLGGVQEKTAAAMAAVQSIINTVMTAVSGFWQENGAQIMAFTERAWSQVQSIVANTVGLISAILTELAAFIEDNSAEIEQIMTGAWQIIEGIIGGILTLIQGTVQTVLQLVQGDFSGAWETIQQMSAEFVVRLGDIIMGLWNVFEPGLKHAWSEFVSWATDLGGDVVGGIVKGIGDNAGALLTSLKDLATKGLAAAKEALGISSPSRVFAAQVGTPITQGITQGIQEGSGEAFSAITTMVGGVLSGAKDALGIGAGSASEMFKADVGKALPAGIAEGIGQAQPKAEAAVEKMADALRAKAKDLLKIKSPSQVFAEEVGAPISQGIAAGIIEAIPEVQDALDLLGEEALKQFEGIANQMSKLMDESLSGRVGLLRGQSSAQGLLASLEAEKKKADAAMKKRQQYNPNMTDEERAEFNKIGQAQLSVNARLQYAQEQLNKASEDAARIGAKDAKAGADFLSKRQSQIKELLGLQEALGTAEDEQAYQRAKVQYDLVRRAQEVEIEQLQNSLAKRAGELGGLGDGYTETGNQIVDGMIKGMQNRSQEMADALKNVLMFALRGAQESLGIKSPSLVFAQQVGGPITEGVAMGILDSASVALGAVGDLTSQLIRPAAPAIARGMTGGSSVTNNYNYQPSYNGAPRQPSQDFAAMRVLSTAR